MLDLVNAGPMLLARCGLSGETSFDNFVGTSLLISSLACSDPTSSVFRHAVLGVPLAVRSFSCLGLALVVLDFLQPDMLLLPRSLAQVGAASLALDLLHLGLLLPLQSFSCFGPALLVLDPLQLDMLLLPQSLAKSDFAAAAPDLSRFEFPLLALDPLSLELLLLLHSLSCLELVLSALDSVNPGPMLLVRSGLLGETRFDDIVGISLFVSSLACAGPTLSVFALAQVGVPLVAKSFS